MIVESSSNRDIELEQSAAVPQPERELRTSPRTGYDVGVQGEAPSEGHTERQTFVGTKPFERPAHEEREGRIDEVGGFEARLEGEAALVQPIDAAPYFEQRARRIARAGGDRTSCVEAEE